MCHNLGDRRHNLSSIRRLSLQSLFQGTSVPTRKIAINVVAISQGDPPSVLKAYRYVNPNGQSSKLKADAYRG